MPNKPVHGAEVQGNNGWREFQQHYAKLINQNLANTITALPDLNAPLKSAMEYSLLAGGKRIRPFLLFATGTMLEVDEAKLLPCAIALECIHTYSLIHDDLPAMDDDDLRRGQATCHIAFDEATAILAGDALQALAYQVILGSKQLNAVQKQLVALDLSNASGYQGMCGGQSLDIAFTDTAASLPELQQIHQLKTGALILSSITMATHLAQGIGEQTRERLTDFGKALGLAFQVKDDILDVEGATEALGKPQGSDESINKSTYPKLMGLADAKTFLQSLRSNALQALDAIPYNTGLLESFTDYVVNRDH